MSRILFSALILLHLFGLCLCASPLIYRKELAGPPEEFPLHVLPSPLKGALQEGSALLPVHFQNRLLLNGEVESELEIFVDSSTAFAFTIFSPESQFMNYSLTNSQGNNIQLPQGIQEKYEIGEGSAAATTLTFTFVHPTPGRYVLNIKSNTLPYNLHQKLVKDDKEPDALVLVYNESPIQIFSHLQNYNLLTGEYVGFSSSLFDKNKQAGLEGSPLLADSILSSVSSAEMIIDAPDGSEIEIPMIDEEIKGAEVIKDGIYTANFTPSKPGKYKIMTIMKGTTNNGVEVVRTARHLLAITAEKLVLTGTASGERVTKDDERLKIFIGVDGLSTNKKNTYRAYAEVWGKNAQGSEIPICWISGLTQVEKFAGSHALPLFLNLNWISHAGADASQELELRNIYVQEVVNFIPLATADRIPVKTREVIHLVMKKLNLAEKVTQVTKEMRQGKMPAHLQVPSFASSGEDGKLVLVHGYCAARNPWEVSPEDWTNPAYFLNPSANIPNDQFAQLLLAFTANFTSFSLIGHSQGGLVALHLHNYYFSGLERATGGRLIQSVGSPYTGFSQAGASADIAKLFGIACGSNSDLSPDGSQLWLTGITAESRKAVTFYRTTYPQSGASFSSYCNLAINLLIKKPNDGTTELQYSLLEGGNDGGVTEGWCHVEDMKHPPQYTDHSRNKEMNQLASR